LWLKSWDQDWPLEGKHKKNNEAKFSTIQISRENWKKNQSIKGLKKTKQIAIKRIRTKSSIKIKRNKIMIDKIKKKIRKW
jgi:hypothetical protein